MTGYPSPLWRVVALTSEQRPDGSWVAVVRHEFYGDTPQRAIHVYEAHLKTDAFLAQCQRGRFDGVVCYTQLGTPERLA